MTNEDRFAVRGASQSAEPSVAVDLFWIPLGAGACVVRTSGRVYEHVRAAWRHDLPADLFHSALVVVLPEGRYVIEQAPIPDARGEQRGVVAEGPVGSKRLARLRPFRYEVRCWEGGTVPDIGGAVGGPNRLTNDVEIVRKILALLPSVPALTWGRDELGANDIWNSNSVIAWVLSRSGIDAAGTAPPEGGRAPGWRAGLCAARQ